jgi:hypothetical protein
MIRKGFLCKFQALQIIVASTSFKENTISIEDLDSNIQSIEKKVIYFII